MSPLIRHRAICALPGQTPGLPRRAAVLVMTFSVADRGEAILMYERILLALNSSTPAGIIALFRVHDFPESGESHGHGVQVPPANATPVSRRAS